MQTPFLGDAALVVFLIIDASHKVSNKIESMKTGVVIMDPKQSRID